MQGSRMILFMMLRILRRGGHKRKKYPRIQPRWMVERGIPLPPNHDMGSYTNPRDNVNPVWSGTVRPVKPITALTMAPVVIQSHSTGGAGWYFTADGVDYGPCQEWPDIVAKVTEVVTKTGAKDISEIEWRDK